MSATVTIGGVAATNVVVVDSTTITATTPAHAQGQANVQVTVGGVASNVLSNAFNFQPGSGATVQGIYGGAGQEGATGVNWNGSVITLVGAAGETLAQLQTTAEAPGPTSQLFAFNGLDEQCIYFLLTGGSRTFQTGDGFGMQTKTPKAVSPGGVSMYLYESRYPLSGGWQVRIVT